MYVSSTACLFTETVLAFTNTDKNSRRMWSLLGGPYHLCFLTCRCVAGLWLDDVIYVWSVVSE